MDIIDRIKEKARKVLNAEIDNVVQFQNVPNNSVYKIFSDGKAYIFKIYKQKTWPEDGKLLFVNKKLIENNIGCAKIITFDRSDDFFTNGFLIEEYLDGRTADRISFTNEETKNFYIILAELISQYHKIRIMNYGYIGDGIACYDQLSEFFNDEFDERAKKLIENSMWEASDIADIKEIFLDKMRMCDYLPSVLCHGDLSTKNVLVNEEGDFTLIDWDDAISYNWIADVARMTFWMKLNYSEKEAAEYKEIFLDHYSTQEDKSVFYRFENAFHVYFGLDYMNYYIGAPQYDIVKKFFTEAVDKLYAQ